jgi:hypothetical protein
MASGFSGIICRNLILLAPMGHGIATTPSLSSMPCFDFAPSFHCSVARVFH